MTDRRSSTTATPTAATAPNGGPAASLIYGIADPLGRHLPVPDLLDLTTSFKMAPDVMKGNMVPWVDFTPTWLGWRSLGLSPDTIGAESHRAGGVPEALHQFGDHLGRRPRSWP